MVDHSEERRKPFRTDLEITECPKPKLVVTEHDLPLGDQEQETIDAEIQFLDSNLMTGKPVPAPEYDSWQEVVRRQELEESSRRSYRQRRFYSTGLAFWGVLFSAPVMIASMIFMWFLLFCFMLMGAHH